MCSNNNKNIVCIHKCERINFLCCHSDSFQSYLFGTHNKERETHMQYYYWPIGDLLLYEHTFFSDDSYIIKKAFSVTIDELNRDECH